MDQGQNTNGIYTPPRPDFQTVRPVGDIVLVPGGGQSKKKLVTILVVAIVLVLVGVMVAVVAGRVGSSTSTTFESAFNEYANFALFGMDSDEKIEGEYQIGKVYNTSIQLFYTNSDVRNETKKYFNDLKVKLDDFRMAYEERKDDLNATQIEAVDYNLALADFIYNYSKVSDVAIDDVVRKYGSDGLEMANNYVDGYYGVFAKNSLSESVQYGEVMAAYYKNLIEMLDKYVGQECVKQGIDEAMGACANFDLDEEEQKTFDELEYAQTEVVELAEQIAKTFEESCFNIEKIVFKNEGER